ncbi:MAG: AraC family transcriptional regulator [Ruminococcaceae bacterium]|nr:AraC family transcriptional regulator [Oscillospiraceae bacterium]
MHYLFEADDTLNRPIECFYYDPVSKQFPVKLHWHYFMEIIYILEGCAEMRANEQSYYLHSGDMILFHPECVHGIYAADGNPLRYAVMKFDINRLSLTSDYTPKLRSIFRSAEKRGMSSVFPDSFTAAEGIEQHFIACIDEMQQGGYGYDVIVRSHISQLLIKVLRYWQTQGFSVDRQVFAEDNSYDVYNITEYIDKTLSDNVAVSEIAKRCGMSYSYFAKKFLSVYGRSCKEYIEQMRLYKVEELLLYTDFDLNYISQETGYSDCSHMIKSFRRHKGITPKQFRIKAGKE